MSPAFIVTCALRSLPAGLEVWAQTPARRKYFETFAALVLDGPLPRKEVVAAIVREVDNTFNTKGGWDWLPPCCSEPQLVGGRCDNCGVWRADYVAENS